MTESAGNPQDLLSTPATTFVDEDGPADEPIDEFTAEEPRPRRVREGLPPGFRMRHEKHYVDDLSAAPTIRQVAISEIDRDQIMMTTIRRRRSTAWSTRSGVPAFCSRCWSPPDSDASG